jgi:chromosome segregation ATPase
MSASLSDTATRTEATQLMGDLRERLQKSELALEEMKRHNESLQIRLDDTGKEQAKQEEKMHEDEERIEDLENAKRELLKQKRELETIFEAERAAVMKDRESTTAREEELQTVIQRLKDSLSQKDSLKPGNSDELSVSRNCTYFHLGYYKQLYLTIIFSQFYNIFITNFGYNSFCAADITKEQLDTKQL